jgi:hypothetical protein
LAASQTAKIEKRPSEMAKGALMPSLYQLLAGKFHYPAEQWNFAPEQRYFGLAGRRYSVDMAKINEKSANR